MNMQSQIKAALPSNSTTEYQLRSMTGRVVKSHSDLDRAQEDASERGLRLFMVTTISKEITCVAA